LSKYQHISHTKQENRYAQSENEKHSLAFWSWFEGISSRNEGERSYFCFYTKMSRMRTDLQSNVRLKLEHISSKISPNQQGKNTFDKESDASDYDGVLTFVLKYVSLPHSIYGFVFMPILLLIFWPLRSSAPAIKNKAKREAS
jgi:hypothetical protein